MKNWHTAHQSNMRFGDRVADKVSDFVGSWTFLGIQTALMAFWVAGNIYLIFHFDPFPFVFLNLFMSAEAAYSTPIIMMSQNRASERDRMNAEADYQTNVEAERRIEEVQKAIARMEKEKLNKILRLFSQMSDEA